MLGLFDGPDDRSCRCRPSFEEQRLVVRSDDCPGQGELDTAPDCRATVVQALTDRDAETVLTRYRGRERVYEEGATALLVAAGRFADAVAFHDERLAERACRDPLGTASEAVSRAGTAARLAAETGLAAAAGQGKYSAVLRPHVGPSLARSRVTARPPPDARLVDAYDLDTGATVRVYDHSEAIRRYHLTPLEATLGPDALATLDDAHERLAREATTGERGPGRAVRAVASDDAPVGDLTRILEKHTRGWGVLTDLFADSAVSDVFATAPVCETPLRVRMDGDRLATNVRLTERGAAALASQFRLESGRAFSRATPTLDAATTVGGRQVRAAGVTAPVSDGLAFAFRAHDDRAWTLDDLVENGTLPPRTAALLSVAVERGAALLVAGARGAGKTTLLGALLASIPGGMRTLVVEDTPELPVGRLQNRGRDIQRLQMSVGDGPGLTAAEALRAGLRLGEGALVVGEVRGEEAEVLYEAMRVGAADGAVLGTIHGSGGAGVRERVVEDLGVPAGSFAVTDAVVTVHAHERDTDGRRGRTVTIEEVVDGPEGPAFAPLAGPESDGRLDRGESRLLASLAHPGECYADARAAVSARREQFEPREPEDQPGTV